MFLSRPHPGVVTGPQPRLLARLAGRHASPATAPLPALAARRAFHGFGGSLKLLHDQLQAKPELQRAASSSAAPGAGAGAPPELTVAPPLADTTTPTVPAAAGGAPPRRRGSRLIAAALFLLAGVAAGSSLRMLVAPPAPPAPGSDEDGYALAVLASRAAQLPVVRALAADPAWAPSWPAYASVPAADAPRRLTTGPLAGSRGVGGFQRVFRNAATGEVVVVAYLGAATGGWPGIVHGGLAATLLDEACGRCAAGVLPAGTGVTARLELNYRAPTLTNGFYVLRAAPEAGAAPAAGGKEEAAAGGRRKVWVDARLETTEGKLCVEARALFVAPKGFELRKIDEGF